MKLGIALPQASELDLRSLRAFVETARSARLDSLWVGDHLVFPPRVPRENYPYIENMHDEANLFGDYRWFESVVTLATTAGLDEHFELGFGVLLPALRNPLVLAKQLATIDALSRGRLIVGMGVGWMQEEYRALGVAFEERVGRLSEMVDILRLLWTGRAVSFEGRYWVFDEVIALPTPAGGPDLRLWYGGNDLRLLERLAPRVQGWLPYEPSPETIAQGMDVVARARSEAAVTGDFSIAAVTRLQLSEERSLDHPLALVTAYCDAGVEHLVVLSSMGRDAESNRRRAQRLGKVRDLHAALA